MDEEMNQDEGINVLKTRSDPEPLSFVPIDVDKFKVCTGSRCSWLEKEGIFTSKTLRPRIEPWLTALSQSEHHSLLIGSGLTHAVHMMATGHKLPGMSRYQFNVFKEQIDDGADASAKRAGRDSANIEDQIRVANELLVGLRHYCPLSAAFRGSRKLQKDLTKLDNEISQALYEFAGYILDGERGIACASEDKREDAFTYLVNFLMSFASRSGTRDRLHIFTSNYDRLIEVGSEVAGLHLMDRFVGNVSPIFRSSRLNIDMHYNPPGIRGEPRYLEGVARFTKLHGSVDWIYVGRDIRRFGLPFGADSVQPYFKAPGLSGVAACSLMIYPNSAKDRETAVYPYVELFRDFSAAICRPNNTLVTYGYSFGDEHINRVIEDMLTIPSTHLVIISRDDSIGRIMSTYRKAGRPSQMTLLIGNHLGDLKTLVDHYLPKPAIDRTTFRMAELLKARLGTEDGEINHKDDVKGGVKSESDPG